MEGRAKKMLRDNAATPAASLVSAYSQIIASSDTNGSDASSAPAIVLRLAASEIAKTSSAVTASLRT